MFLEDVCESEREAVKPVLQPEYLGVSFTVKRKAPDLVLHTAAQLCV